ncbi:hypothetical protein BWQ96_05994 [Gracilariopsis chorda]|uniref:Uncharacterized protein n=1 Tax=Gracilariopsis chorda TaxID=448386 RepID=A0A2V3IQ77_9FLOR|nr:hypothetical protein BWQ96_05994 [Gracilariopsis chorda]|eukprot:PXF44213.1 hypothetical protein BWQ96_05994 [Gracilariopsis chorda]
MAFFLRSPLTGTVIVLASLLCIANAVQLADLTSTTDYRWYPSRLRTLPDDTLLITATATYPFSQLSLHPIVSKEPGAPRYHETILLTRIHASNSTVLWAAATWSFQNHVDFAVDSANNVYLTGAQRSINDSPSRNIAFIKYSSSGQFEWRRTSSIQQISRQINTEFIAISTGRTVGFAPPNSLLLPVVGLSGLRRQVFIAAFDSSSAGFTTAVEMPKLLLPATPEEKVFSVDPISGVPCLVQRQEYPGLLESRHRLFVHCSLPGPAEPIRSRVLPMDGGEYTIFSVAGDVQQSIFDTDKSVLHLAYERIANFSYREGSKGNHELLVHRFDTSTMQTVDWKTDVLDRAASPLVFRVPAPKFPDAGVRFTKLLYARAYNSLIMLLTTSVDVEDFFQSEEGGEVEVRAKSGEYIFPPANWLVFIDQSKKVTTTQIPRDPRMKPSLDSFNNMLKTNLQLSPDESMLYLYGYLEVATERGDSRSSGPLYVHKIPVPLERIGGMGAITKPPPSISVGPTPFLGVESTMVPTPASIEPSESPEAEAMMEPTPLSVEPIESAEAEPTVLPTPFFMAPSESAEAE